MTQLLHQGSLRFDDATDAVAFLERLARGDASSGDMQLVGAAARAWLRAGAAVSLDRLLGLPSTLEAKAIDKRNAYLKRAAMTLEPRSDHAGFVQLEQLWGRFAGTVYLAWRDDGEPPLHASELHFTLFYATKHNCGDTLTYKQLRTILGSRFFSQLPK